MGQLYMGKQEYFYLIMYIHAFVWASLLLAHEATFFITIQKIIAILQQSESELPSKFSTVLLSFP